MSSKNESKGDLVAKVNFPLYAVEMLTDRHFIVAGGGGSAKTGVSNGFAMYELAFNGEQCVANCIGKHDTGTQAVMNCACYEDRRAKKTHFVAGKDNYSASYFILKKFEVARSHSYSDQNDNSERGSENSARNRNPSGRDLQRNGRNPSSDSLRRDVIGQRTLRLLARQLEMVQTAKSLRDATSENVQEVVRISPNGKFMATGASDGSISIWQFPSLKLLREIQAHRSKVDDLDFSPDSQKLVSASRDGCAFIWYTRDGTKVSTLDWTPPKEIKYNFRRCRFAVGECEGQRPRLFTLANSTHPKHTTCFLQSWDTSSFLPVRSVAQDSTISQLAVSPCGKFVATASMFNGCVNVYTCFNLKSIYRVEGAHSTFITGLAFVPCHTETGKAITGQSDGAVISVSVDNQIRVHRIPPRRLLIPLWVAIGMVFLVVCLSFAVCSYLGL